MGSRLEFHDILCKILGDENRVYYQPPASILLKYPCIVYGLDTIQTKHADNAPYSRLKRYQVTVIDRDPDSDIPDKVGWLPTASFSRHFTSDQLNHDVYNVHY